MGDDRLLADFTGDFERVAPLTLLYHDSPHKEEISSRIKDFYFPGGNFSKAAIVDVSESPSCGLVSRRGWPH